MEEAKNQNSYPPILLCNICKNVYINPRVLPCNHSFCYNCLSQLFKNEAIICPSCEMINEIKNLDATPQDDLINFTLETLKLDKSSIKCQECETNDASLYCKNCAVNYCEECSSKIIHVLKSMKNHVFSDVKEKLDQTCNIHDGHKLELYWKTCDNFVCLKCSILDHKNHLHEDIEKAEKSYKISLEEKIKNNKMKEFLKESYDNLESFKNKQTKNLNDFEKEINLINNLIILLENKREEFMNKLETTKNEQNSKIKLYQNELDYHNKSLLLFEINIQQNENIHHLQKINIYFDNLITKYEKNIKTWKTIDAIKILSLSPIKKIQDEIDGLHIQIIRDLEFNFTTLGAKGRYGPSSLEGYKNTSLEGKITLLNGIQEWKVPFNGNYRIKVAGAEGGIGNRANPKAGKGAIMEGTFSLKKDSLLKILVGQKGLSDVQQRRCGGGGGGGGTFVALKNSVNDSMEPLIIGGGGNGDNFFNFKTDGLDALITNKGDIGGKRENGSTSGGGGSFTNNGEYNTNNSQGTSFFNGGLGGINVGNCGYEGGFGGGGGTLHEGGGGGGYTGGCVVPAKDYTGKYENLGAGSYNMGDNQNNVGGANTGDGFVKIQLVF